MIRRLLTLGLLLAVYALLTVAALEVGLRLFRLAPPAEPTGFFWRVPDPVTGWSLQPNAEGRWFNPMYEYDQHIRINALGLRSPEEIGYDKPEGVYRILVLGDSFVEAMQVAQQETFSQRLAQMLNEAGALHEGAPVRVEVVSAGVGGWGTDQQLLWLQHEGYKYDPDLIVLAFFAGNDFMNNYMPLELANLGAVRKPWFELRGGALQLNDFPFDPDAARESRNRIRARFDELGIQPTIFRSADAEGVKPLSGLGDWLHRHSALYRYLDPRIRRVAPGFAAWLANVGLIDAGQESSDRVQGPDYIPIAYGVYASSPSPAWEEAFRTTTALLQAMRREAERLNVPLRGVLLPASEELDADKWRRILQSYPAMQERSWRTDQAAERAKAGFAAAGVPLLDLAPLFREQMGEGKRLYLRDDGHFTAEGHAVAAHALSDWLTSDPNAATLSVQRPLPTLPRAWGHLVWRIFVWVVVALLGISLLWSIYKNGLRVWLRNVGLNLSTAGELLLFLVRRRNFVLLPLALVLLLFGGLLIVAQASVVGPFIYTLF